MADVRKGEYYINNADGSQTKVHFETVQDQVVDMPIKFAINATDGGLDIVVKE